MKQCFGDLDPQELTMCCHHQRHFSEPKMYFKGSTSGALFFLSGLEFQNPSLLSFNKKERSKLLRVGVGLGG